jgi:hypothetical protein
MRRRFFIIREPLRAFARDIVRLEDGRRTDTDRVCRSQKRNAALSRDYAPC